LDPSLPWLLLLRSLPLDLWLPLDPWLPLGPLLRLDLWLQ